MDPSSGIAAPSPLLEVTAPVRIEGESDSQTIFTWMVTNRYLWMLDGRWSDRVEDLVGTGRLLRLVGRRIGWARNHPGHPALELPDDEPARDFAFARLARFLEMHIVLDEVVNASRPDAKQKLLEPMESPQIPAGRPSRFSSVARRSPASPGGDSLGGNVEGLASTRSAV